MDEPRLRTLDFDDSDDDEDLTRSGNEMQDVQSETTATSSAEPTPSVPDTLRQLDDVDMNLKAMKPIVGSRNSSEAAETATDRLRLTVVVRDVAHSTYYATCVFFFRVIPFNIETPQKQDLHGCYRLRFLPLFIGVPNRHFLIRRPAPCSAKSAHRFADRSSLPSFSGGAPVTER
jgi:hypothetical protein